MRLWLIVVALIFAGCQPADNKAKSVKDRLDAGELVEFTKPGYRRPSCSEKAPDWKNLNGLQETDRELIITNQMKAVLNGGKYSCFRVGSAIDLSTSSKNPNAGQAIVVKLGIRKLDKLESKDLGGGIYSQNSVLFALKDKVRAKLSERDQGFVTIVHLQYIPNSAPDEKSIREKVAREAQTDGLVETQKDGDSISNCENNKWTDLVAPEALHTDLISGKLRTMYQFGERNCFAQGALVEIKAKRGDPPKGQVRVVRIKRLRTSFLNRDHFSSTEDFEAIEKLIKADRSKQEWVSLMMLEPASTPVKENCTYKINPVSLILPTYKADSLLAETWTIQLRGKTCYEIGELVTLNIVSADSGQTVSIPARVILQSHEGDGSTVVLENLG